MCRAVLKSGWFVFTYAIVTSLTFSQANAEVFDRNLQELSFGRGAGFQVDDGRFDGVPGAKDLVKLNNNLVQVNANGVIPGFALRRRNGLVQRLQLQSNGNVIALGDRRSLSGDELRQVFNVLSPLSNRLNAVRLLGARATGNAGAFNGRFTLDLDSIAVMLERAQGGIPECKGNKSLTCARLALTEMINQANNGRGAVTISAKSVRTTPNGKHLVTLDLSRVFNAKQLAIFAGSDETGPGCLGFMRGETVINKFLDPRVWPDVKGIRGLSRDQVYDLVGCNKRKTDTVGNKVLVMGADGRSESGITGAQSRVVKWEVQRNDPGALCIESDDFPKNAPAGVAAASQDVRQTGIFYQQAASEDLLEQPNGLDLGLLFNAQGVQQDATPSDVTTDRVVANISCMNCHAKGTLGCGRKIKNDGRSPELYHNNLGSITNEMTVFRDRFNKRLSNRDFFTDNATCRRVMNFRAARKFRAQAKMGLLEVMGQDGYPLPFAAKAFEAYAAAPKTPAEIAREIGASEAAVKAVVPAPLSPEVEDKQLCAIAARVGVNRGSGFLADQGRGTGVRDLTSSGRIH